MEYWHNYQIKIHSVYADILEEKRQLLQCNFKKSLVRTQATAGKSQLILFEYLQRIVRFSLDMKSFLKKRNEKNLTPL
jgi:hypothetical protein